MMKKIYFASDLHLGSCVMNNNKERERMFVQWAESIIDECDTLFLLGDMFDFWFEYDKVVPKGYVRFLSAICKFTDRGIPVNYIVGNHDLWAFDYLEKECGVKIYREDNEFSLMGKSFYIGHGDGLDAADKGYLFLRKVFKNRFLQCCFKIIHPDLGIRMAHSWSSKSRLKGGHIEAAQFQGEDKESIVQFCKNKLQEKHYDFFVFGHRHLPMDIKLSENSQYVNTGDWLTHFTFAEFDGSNLSLKTYK